MADRPKRRLSDFPGEIDFEISSDAAAALDDANSSAALAISPEVQEAMASVSFGFVVEATPELRKALEEVEELSSLATCQAPVTAFSGIDAAVINELANFSSTVPVDSGAFAEIDAAVINELAQVTQATASGTALSKIDFDTFTARMEALKTHFRIIDAAIEEEVGGFPFTALHKDPFDLVRDFSIHPKGLGLSEEEFLDVFDRGDWMRSYQGWKESRRSKESAGKKPLPETSDEPKEPAHRSAGESTKPNFRKTNPQRRNQRYRAIRPGSPPDRRESPRDARRSLSTAGSTACGHPTGRAVPEQ